MASIPISARAESHPNVRPLNVLRDLPAVADLIELCFSDTMDRDGQRYVQDMRRAGRDDSFLRWATRMAESTSLPLTGYVWEVEGKLVGNASLVPFRHKGARVYLVANVAVHPDYRRRGIARDLTQKSIQHAMDRKAAAVWLHVRDDNPGAIQLYTDLGFVERARRTTWQAQGDSSAMVDSPGISITRRPAQHWPQQQTWLGHAYPDELAWYRSWNFSRLQPGLLNWLYMTLLDLNVRQWSALWGPAQQLEAALAWIPTGLEPNGLWLAARPEPAPQAITSLLLHARRSLSLLPNLSLDFPGGELQEAIQAAGFHALRTLIWMQYLPATS